MARRKGPSAGNGKSLLEMVRAVVGEYIASKTGKAGPVDYTSIADERPGHRWTRINRELRTFNDRQADTNARGSIFTREVISQDNAQGLKDRFSDVRRVYSKATRVGVLSDVASRGGVRGSLAEGELVQMGIDAGGSIANNRVVRSLAMQVGKALGQDRRFGLRLLQGLGRTLGLAGGVAAIAQAGFAVAGEYFEQRQNSARAQLRAFNAAAAGNFEASFAKNSRDSIRRSVMNSRSAFQQLSDEFGFTENTEKAVSDRAVQMLATYNKARGAAERMGINVNSVLAEYAKRKGVSIQSLTPAEKNEALDPVVKAELESRVPESAVEDRFKAKGLRDKPAGSTVVMSSGTGGYFQVRQGSGAGEAAYNSAKREEFREEIQSEIVNELSARDGIDQKSAEKAMALRTPEERRSIELSVRQSQYKLTAARSRHKMVWGD